MLAKAPERPTQLLLSFPTRTAMGREDFLVGASNSDAFSLVAGWPQWGDPIQLILGPPGSGKTHLVEIWAQASNAHVARDRFIVAEALGAIEEGRPVALEIGNGDTRDAHAIFHVLNAARQARTDLLLTAREDWVEWCRCLPDLASRMRAIPPCVLGAPDDDLLGKVIVKLFADRQTPIERSVLDYALLRLERSFEAANLFVARCDEIALRSGRKITKNVAADALYALEAVDEPAS